ncbi:MAG: dTDP-4-dehydrorhamnose reductase [Gammaproteobacteria bacterium]
MRILLTGKNGQVGWELERTLAPLGEVIALGRDGMDLADADSVCRVIREVRPKLIVNAGAYTAVDKAESDPELAMKINGVAPGVMAEEAKKLNAALVHYSTDYVFDGIKTERYKEEDAPNPVNVYGRTKLAGERAIQVVDLPHLILRTSWVYGLRGKNFLLTIQRLAKERDEIRIVEDQIGTPTWSRMIAETTAHVLTKCCASSIGSLSFSSGVSGLYNLTASGATSWYGFAQAIIASFRSKPIKNPRLTPISSAEYPLPAKRPANSCLCGEKLARCFGVTVPDWKEGLRLCLDIR